MAWDVPVRFLIPGLLNHCVKKSDWRFLTDGAYPAIVASQVLDEGVDVPVS